MINPKQLSPEVVEDRQRAIDMARVWAQAYNRPFSERTEAYSLFVDALDDLIREASR
jgi:hypothetical protein